MKDAYYFPHDSNAKDDPKIVLLIEQLGLEGYGIYWVLIETLRDQPDYKYPLSLLPALGRRYTTSGEKVETVVRNYRLFEIEGNEFFLSPSLSRRMEKINATRRRLSNAGKKGRALQLQGVTGQVQARAGQPPGNKGKERKVKESKEKEIKSVSGICENVFLSSTEKSKLDDRFGSSVDEKIDSLSEYMESRGKSYKSHYATILSWDRKDKKRTLSTSMHGSASSGANSTEKRVL
ncbi:MAG: hypothetical protein ACI8ZB_002666 [Desulforhopalus sp.]|jgi:hypothetical protein